MNSRVEERIPVGSPDSVFSFDKAKRAIDKYANKLAGSGDSEDREGALLIANIVRNMGKPGQEGVEGIQEAIKYIEGVLQTKQALGGQNASPGIAREREEQIAVRDALLAEKLRRDEQPEEPDSSQESSEVLKNQITRSLENLYANTDMSEHVPSRQEMMRRVNLMNGEELFYLDDDLRKVARKYNRTRDSKELNASLFDLVSKKYSKEDVLKRTEEERFENLRSVKESLGMEAGPVEEVPNDRRGLIDYFRANFSELEKAPLEQFKDQFDAVIEKRFQAYVAGLLRNLMQEKSGGTRYPDTVASVLGNDVGMLQRVIALKEGRVVDQGELLRQPFSRIAREYLNVDLPADYFEHFSGR